MAAPGTKWVTATTAMTCWDGSPSWGRERISASTLIGQRIAEPLGLQETYLPVTGTGLQAPCTRGYAAGATQAPTTEEDATPLPQSCL